MSWGGRLNEQWLSIRKRREPQPFLEQSFAFSVIEVCNSPFGKLEHLQAMNAFARKNVLQSIRHTICSVELIGDPIVLLILHNSVKDIE